MTEIVAGATIDTARRTLAARLAAAGLDSPELDARLLVGHAMQLDLTGLVMHGQRQLSQEDAQRLDVLAVRRLAGEPVARILGTREFWGLELQLSADTLVPRPDTETVVELALEHLTAGGDLKRRLRIADLGTGSGAILLALLSELPRAYGVGTDISVAALETARDNARALGLADRAGFVACSFAAALQAPFDLIVSNPPYIPSTDIEDLAIEVRAHDPRRALDGGGDGLDAYRALIPQAARLLQPGGALVVEVGVGQSGDVATLMTEAGLAADSAGVRADLGGISRAVMALKKVR
ncbi:peptide chain release factor N(5)-glutamine methyltransferase [Bradyrhizobium sp. 83012]|uniref:Release factor glutamine methyltransferase n=1 Tax=Bradyrhizobium aeschynomenes TaxID=2734909 RepID=A0ABX2CNJ2_9BRAD|nr:peptide chain release factor N(5)-glutamine methyltransferase [Bradyrhizobium aeschynomenes]NPU69405.1 peptide chain release factor N(5)-glutamine methyltransferase [Bradyrhizobium aeschynomenes]